MQTCNHDDLFDLTYVWLKLPPEQRTREQQAVIDTLHTIGMAEGDGLHHVWQEQAESMPRVAESFRLIGFPELADALESTSFCREVIAKGLNRQGHWRFTKSQDLILSRVERLLFKEVENVHEAAARLVKTSQ